jgi:hypothetical protein
VTQGSDDDAIRSVCCGWRYLLSSSIAPNAHAVVRLTIARALISLNVREAAPVLMRHAEADGLDTARLVEPTLARWGYAPMRPIWAARLADARTPRGPLVLAAQAAAIIRLAHVTPDLRRLAMEPGEARDVRLEAARRCPSCSRRASKRTRAAWRRRVARRSPSTG